MEWTSTMKPRPEDLVMVLSADQFKYPMDFYTITVKEDAILTIKDQPFFKSPPK